MTIDRLITKKEDFHVGKLTASYVNILHLQRYFDRKLELHNASAKARININYGISEAIYNSIKHAYGGREDCEIEVKYWLSKDEFKIAIKDNGSGFDVAHWKKWYEERDESDGNVEWPGYHEPGERGSGMGLLKIHKAVDKVEFNEKGNEITLVKRLEK